MHMYVYIPLHIYIFSRVLTFNSPTTSSGRLWKWHFHRHTLQVLAPQQLFGVAPWSHVTAFFWGGIYKLEKRWVWHPICRWMSNFIGISTLDHFRMCWMNIPRLTAVGCLVGARILDRTICVYSGNLLFVNLHKLQHVINKFDQICLY